MEPDRWVGRPMMPPGAGMPRRRKRQTRRVRFLDRNPTQASGGHDVRACCGERCLWLRNQGCEKAASFHDAAVRARTIIGANSKGSRSRFLERGGHDDEFESDRVAPNHRKVAPRHGRRLLPVHQKRGSWRAGWSWARVTRVQGQLVRLKHRPRACARGLAVRTFEGESDQIRPSPDCCRCLKKMCADNQLPVAEGRMPRKTRCAAKGRFNRIQVVF
jgi:hypothetical protein